MLSRGIRLPADNAAAHSSQIAVDKARACDLQHPLYSPDLVCLPSDFFLFPEMKNPFRRRQFNNRDDVINEVGE